MMETFAELLSAYIRRLGISDTELARSIGVRRQTIFRWREGMTARPRHRDDVLILAEKLRLTPEEQNKLLVAAGFAPEVIESPLSPDSGVLVPATHDDATAESVTDALVVTQHDGADIVQETTHEVSHSGGQSNWRRPVVMAGAAVVGLLLAVLLLPQLWRGSASTWLTPTPAATLTARFLAQPTPQEVPYAFGLEPAQPDETLILVTQFANYAGEGVGYNVAGRLVETLQQEIDDAGLASIRVEAWPEAVSLHKLALQAGQSVSATLTLYGEYDAGRVVLQFAHPSAETELVQSGILQEVDELEKLTAVINQELPEQLRPVALLVLGQIYVIDGAPNQARGVLMQAQRRFEQAAQIDDETLGTLSFYLGIAFDAGDPPLYDEAIAAYDAALEARPDLLSARLNRSVTYYDRRQSGDLEKALADANYVIRAVDEWAIAYNNRAIILMASDLPDRLTRAEADLNRAIELHPELSSAYVNRAIVRFDQGESVENWKEDIEMALSLEPDSPEGWNMLCWGYGVENKPELAIDYCEEAVLLEPRPSFLDSRGLSYALLGNYEQAIADFEVFIAWLETQSGQSRQQRLAERRLWVEALKAQENPFTPDVLAGLRDN